MATARRRRRRAAIIRDCFVGNRVPLYNLFDYLEAGDSLDKFLASFPSVTREQAVAALELAKEAVGDVATSLRR
ncbi:MAG TPA: DUF433 domain-containing protein [Thermoanaerobaculia bacterium]